MQRIVGLITVVLSLMLLFQVAQTGYSAQAGLVAAYSFDQGSGAVAADASGNSNNGTISGATWTAAGKYGSALSFDGVNDIVIVNDAVSLRLTNGMTLSAWVKPASLSAWKSIVMKENTGNLAYALYGNTGGNTPSGEIKNSSNRAVGGTAKLPNDTWSYLTTTYDGASLKLYVNGALVGTLATTGNIASANNKALVIGGNRVWSSEYFAGLIDEVRVYNRALSAAEIAVDMNAPVAAPAATPTAVATSTALPTATSTAVVVATPTNTAMPSATATRTPTPAATGTPGPTATPSGDTVLPNVSITAPTAGTAVSGSVTVTASASDNVAVAGVQFLINDLPVGPEDTTNPYSYAWNTLAGANGPYTLTAIARDTSGNLKTSAPIAVTVNNPIADVSPPVVSVTAPTNGAIVSGNVAVAADATDDVGVVGVQFRVDGLNVGAEDVVAPYTYTWNSTGAALGTHVLTAVARDASGKSTTSPQVTVTLSDANAADQIGAWGPIMSWPLVAVHTTLMTNGKLLVWDAWEYGTTTAKVWNPATNAWTDVAIDSQVFCAAQSFLPDGRILVTGGHNGGGVGIDDASIFSPVTNSWTRLADMVQPRWYPTNITLPDGRTLILSGEITSGLWADYPEIYSPYTNELTTMSVNTGSMHDPEYPLAYLLPNGNIFSIGATPGTAHYLDMAAQTWSNLGAVTKLGSAAMYLPGKIIYSGGGNGSPSSASDAAASIIDFTQGTAAWRTIAPMHYGRHNHTMVVLPDGKLMVVGGATTLDQTARGGVLTPELWDPTTETWKDLAPNAQARLYHSTALLMPDGRVLSAGGGRWLTALDYPTAEIYSPPYLFKGPRPTITSAPATANYGTSITVTTPDAADIASVSLVGLGAETHSIDMNQHFVPLGFTKGAGSLSVSIPSNAAVAPPGPYMLFILNSQGVPSIASMISMNAKTEAVAPAVTLTAPAAGATVSGATVQLSATASDASGIASVEFLAGATRIGKTTVGNPYTVAWDTTTTINGPYTLTAVAEDVYGNRTTSAPVTVTVSNSSVPPPSTGLVLALGMNEGSGSTVNDTSGFSNSGQIYQASWVTAGKYGKALSFDGVNDWVTVNDSLSLRLSTGMTVSAWVKPSTLSGWRTVVMKERPGHLTYALYANMGSNVSSAEIWTDGVYSALGTAKLPTNTWSYLTSTYDGTRLKLYVNGTLVSSMSASANIGASVSPLRIGGNGTWSNEFFNGVIDEVRVYNRALSPAEIVTDMNTAIQ